MIRKKRFLAYALVLSLTGVFALALFNFENDISILTRADDGFSDSVDASTYQGYGCSSNVDNQTIYSFDDFNPVPEFLSGFGCDSTCGEGRASGYKFGYSDECRNWQLLPLYTPRCTYYIDESSLSNLTDTEKTAFIDCVDRAAQEWNNVRVPYFNGPIVNLVKRNELGSVPVRYNPNLENVRGQFFPVPFHYRLELKEYHDYGICLHEFGHMLGLQDLDLQNDPWTHKSLMGYNGIYRMTYHDIQGLSVSNGTHLFHDYRRYWQDGIWYHYVCFYCDAVNTRVSNWSGGEHLESADSCVHDFEEIASVYDKHWLKCEKCYKVVESDFDIECLNVSGIRSLRITGPLNPTKSIQIIPDEIGGLHVTSISDDAFRNNSYLTQVSISEHITNIGDNAFRNCSNLNRATINRNLIESTNLGLNVFADCESLEEIVVPKNFVGDYKNKVNWNVYRDLITYYGIISPVCLDGNDNISLSNNFTSGMKLLWKLIVSTSSYYKFLPSSSNLSLVLYGGDFNTLNSFSNNITRYINEGTYYLSMSFNNPLASGTASMSIVYESNHMHYYSDPYIWRNNTQHISTCSCGETRIEGHAVSSGGIMPGLQYAFCLLCGGRASVGFVGQNSTTPYPSTENGSYILPNGVVVLVDADIEAYINGLLTFDYSNDDILV